MRFSCHLGLRLVVFGTGMGLSPGGLELELGLAISFKKFF